VVINNSDLLNASVFAMKTVAEISSSTGILVTPKTKILVSTGMRRITTILSATDRVYNGGPIRL
jgi:hypothetical protein